MNTLLLCLVMCAAALSWAGIAQAREPLDRPNVVIVYLDDSGYGDFEFTGNKDVKTPRLNRMKDEGLFMRQFYSGSPLCSASRYALMTGKSPSRSGFSQAVLRTNSAEYIKPAEQTLAETMKQAGYVTGMIGKWHLGVPNKANKHDKRALPQFHGFDSYVGIPYSNDMKPTPLLQQPGHSKPYPGAEVLENPVEQDSLTLRYFGMACEFVRRNKSAPFFLYLAPAMPHYPLHVSEEGRGKSLSGRLYDDVIQEIDRGMGQLLDAIDEEGIGRNTLVIFSSDNGPWLAMGADHAGKALPFRDGKCSCFEGGTRVPGLFRWTGVIAPGQTNDSVASVLDIHPTLCVLTKQEFAPFGGHADGRSIAHIFNPKFGDSTVKDEDYALVMTGEGEKDVNKVVFVRWRNWKLIVRTFSHLWSQNIKKGHNSPFVEASMEHPLLYDLSQDIAETTNVAEQHPDITTFLKQKIEAFEKTLEKKE